MKENEILTPENIEFKSGYVSLIGKPNVGKSTLLNHLVSEKIAAISRRPQTTRNKITGVCHLSGGQIIILDTPGIHKPSTKLNQVMVQTSLNTFSDVDIILFMIDARQKFCAEDEYVLESLKKTQSPKILVINKIDLVSKPDLLKLIDEMSAKEKFLEILPISALQKDGLDLLKNVLLKYLPEGPPYFPKDMITNCPEQFLAEEIIREKIIRQTHFEIPYAVAVVVQSMVNGKNDVIIIDANIYVERTSQKKIIIGEKGSLLKKIGSSARLEIEKRFGNKVYLNLFVKVKEKWRENLRDIREFGYSHGHN